MEKYHHNINLYMYTYFGFTVENAAIQQLYPIISCLRLDLDLPKTI